MKNAIVVGKTYGSWCGLFRVRRFPEVSDQMRNTCELGLGTLRPGVVNFVHHAVGENQRDYS